MEDLGYEFGKFIISDEGKKKLETMSEAQIDMMAHLLASNIVRMQREIEDEMKPTPDQP